MSWGVHYLIPQSEQRLPWWAWASGAAGVAMTALGISWITSGNLCDGDATTDYDEECVDGEQTFSRGTLMLATAVPLLSVPLSTWLRSRPKGAMLSMRIVTGGASWVAQGRF